MTMFSISDAYALAREAHAGQVDKAGEDYYHAHLVPIAEALRPFGADAEIAGVLHDIIEDQGYSAERLLALGVPRIAVEAVVAVSRIPGEPYKALILRAAAHPLGRLVKLADNKHNLDSNFEFAKIDPKQANSMRENRYLPARRVLLAAEAAGERRILA